MMSFLNDLPYLLGQRYIGAQFRECIADDSRQTGWHVILRNGWRVSVQDVIGNGKMEVMACPDFPDSLHYNFDEDFSREDICDVLVGCQPHEVLQVIKTIAELPAEVPSDTPDTGTQFT